MRLAPQEVHIAQFDKDITAYSFSQDAGDTRGEDIQAEFDGTTRILGKHVIWRLLEFNNAAAHNKKLLQHSSLLALACLSDVPLKDFDEDVSDGTKEVYYIPHDDYFEANRDWDSRDVLVPSAAVAFTKAVRGGKGEIIRLRQFCVKVSADWCGGEKSIWASILNPGEPALLHTYEAVRNVCQWSSINRAVCFEIGNKNTD